LRGRGVGLMFFFPFIGNVEGGGGKGVGNVFFIVERLGRGRG